MTAIVGASGSGKTTLLQILGTLDTPTGGELFFHGENLTQKRRPGTGAIPQPRRSASSSSSITCCRNSPPSKM